MVLPFIGRILRLVSIVICGIAVVYFAAFAVDQTSSASSHQQAEVNEAGALSEPTDTTRGKPSGLHEALDKVFSKLASPFSGVISSSSAWTLHIVDTLLVLLVYGFGLGFLARLLRLAT
jgi:predicted PurR-regulated permease PerM